MVRLVILSALMFLSACSHMRPVEDVREAQTHINAGELIQQQKLNQGQHHPAISALFVKAEQAREANDLERAFKYLDQARQIQPKNAQILYRQGLVRLKQQQPEKARELLLRAKLFSQDKDLTQRIDSLLNYRGDSL